MSVEYPVRILFSKSVDPYVNLAIENTIFHAMDPQTHVLFLWRNADTVVIGKGQNPWKECNLERMESDGVKLARRQTGGGAVFHDLGNTNFTFMSGKPGYDKDVSTRIVIEGLSVLGVVAEASGRNDLVVDMEDGPRKFSGSAYRETKDRGFHHGTVLIDADLARLANYLNPKPKKLQSKGIASVRSRVCNLVELVPELSHDSVCDAIADAFCRHHQAEPKIESISLETARDLKGFEANFDQQSDWDWNYGKSPAFTHEFEERFEWGSVDVQLEVEKSVIESAKIYTDSLVPELFEAIAEVMAGKKYTDVASLESELAQLGRRRLQDAEMISEFGRWLVAELK